MKLTFLGAAREVTGSCYLIEYSNKKILVDCGMEQGPNMYENRDLPVSASQIDAVFLTHAHIDHSGNLPLLYKRGFRGKIYLTRASRDLCKIMLLDSAHIQEFEAQWRNKKAKRGSIDRYNPVYTKQDAEGAIKLFKACDYDTQINVYDDLKVRFVDAGHLLGSSNVELVITENKETRTIVFSGDIGNPNKPIIRNPSYFKNADYAIMESTYGDRLHGDDPDYVGQLEVILKRTFARNGTVVIPTFAVGRMQELLYFMRLIKARGNLGEFNDFRVFVDSPLAVEATKVFRTNLSYCFDDETRELLDKGINPLDFEGLHTSVTSEDSRAINADRNYKVVLSASGMCEAGRIRHHLKHNLWNKNNTIVFVGYQVDGTLGRTLLDGAKSVKLFGEYVSVKAEIVEMQGTSSHSDMNGLLKWASSFENKPTRLFVTHGEDRVAEYFANKLFETQRQRALAPYNGAEWDLINDECIFEGNKTPIKKQQKDGGKLVPKGKINSVYARLLHAYNSLAVVVKGVEGRTNRDLTRFSEDIESLIKKWEN